MRAVILGGTGAIGERVEWQGALELIDVPDDRERGHHPWRAAHPIVLDTTASTALGYAPVGSSLELLMDEVDWVRLV